MNTKRTRLGCNSWSSLNSRFWNPQSLTHQTTCRICQSTVVREWCYGSMALTQYERREVLRVSGGEEFVACYAFAGGQSPIPKSSRSSQARSLLTEAIPLSETSFAASQMHVRPADTNASLPEHRL